MILVAPPVGRTRSASLPGSSSRLLVKNPGAPGRIRTLDLRIRSPPLYPAELQAQGIFRTVTQPSPPRENETAARNLRCGNSRLAATGVPRCLPREQRGASTRTPDEAGAAGRTMLGNGRSSGKFDLPAANASNAPAPTGQPVPILYPRERSPTARVALHVWTPPVIQAFSSLMHVIRYIHVSGCGAFSGHRTCMVIRGPVGVTYSKYTKCNWRSRLDDRPLARIPTSSAGAPGKLGSGRDRRRPLLQQRPGGARHLESYGHQLRRFEHPGQPRARAAPSPDMAPVPSGADPYPAKPQLRAFLSRRQPDPRPSFPSADMDCRSGTDPAHQPLFVLQRRDPASAIFSFRLSICRSASCTRSGRSGEASSAAS